ncbi:MAG: tRNA epoxyqueuosine(34) reductase QueG, partial [Acidocella sp.]|nr:tRNA epoxyqueuosine(34) reductase QueG [Acidocella sp.]
MAGADLKRQIAAKAEALGFDAIGFCAATLPPERRQNLRDFLAAGHHASMGWMETRADERAN